MRASAAASACVASRSASADARAYEQRTLAEAERDATLLAAEAEAEHARIVGLAEAEAIEAKGLAEAAALKARADALAENQDAVIGQQLAEKWPAIVEAAAKPFGDIDQMIVLNGATGLSEALAQALSQGTAGLQLARNLLSGGGNGRKADERKSTRPPDTHGVS